MKRKLLLLFFLFFSVLSFSQVKILFDAKKAETAANADWVIDADAQNLFWTNTGTCNTCTPAGTNNCHQSNAQRFPTPAQSGVTSTTLEDYWSGGLSYWGIDCVKRGYVVESLPYNDSITFGNSTHVQDLSNYKVYVVCEPNIKFTEREKTAILNFVNAGGSLFIVSDHNISDRNNDGWDSPQIWNDLMKSNSTGNANPFGFIFDSADFSQTSTNLANLPSNDSILHGPIGNVAKVMWSGGTTMTINTTANSFVKPVVFKTSSSISGSTNVMVAYSRYGRGKVIAMGDSSPCDDGTGDPNDVLYTGYMVDVAPNHRNLIMNSTIWLATFDPPCDINYWNGTVSTAWENPYNWSCGTIPDSNTVVHVDASKVNYPIVNSNAICKTLYTSPNVTVKVNSGFKLSVVGHL